MATKKPFCTIDIPDPETAAYLVALTYGAYLGSNNFSWSARGRIEKYFPGGLKSAKDVCFGYGSGRSQVFKILTNALSSIGVGLYSDSPAPWLETKAEWTDERHTEARAYCGGGSSMSMEFAATLKEFAAALNEIERLQSVAQLVKKCEEEN